MATALVRFIRASALTLPAILSPLAACESPSANAADNSSDATIAPAVARAVVDSARPIQELIARFQAASGPPPESLSRAAPSPEALARAFVMALAGRDTAMLRSLTVSRAEYAYLIFPASVMAHPPYELDPEVAWLMLRLESEKGAARALALGEAESLSFAALECPDPEGRSTHRVWSSCLVRLRARDGSTRPAELFGQIVEVGGHHKFLSYANPLPARLRPN